MEIDLYEDYYCYNCGKCSELCNCDDECKIEKT